MAWIEKKKTTKGDRYYVYYWQGKIRHCVKAGNTRELAIRVRNTLENKIVESSNKIVDTKITVYTAYLEYITYSIKTKRLPTVNHIKDHLKPFLETYGQVKISLLNTQDIENYKHSLLRHYKPYGINIKLVALKSFLAYSKERTFIAFNPAKEVKKVPTQKVSRFLTTEEVYRLLNVGCQFNEDLKKIVKVVLYTGMRMKEILELRPNKIANGFITIEQTKTGNPRVIPIHPKILVDVTNLKMDEWTQDRLERAFIRAVKRANLGKLRFHDLRHTFCSKYLESGGTIADLKEISGHKSLSALQIYTHFQPSYLGERINKIEY